MRIIEFDCQPWGRVSSLDLDSDPFRPGPVVLDVETLLAEGAEAAATQTQLLLSAWQEHGRAPSNNAAPSTRLPRSRAGSPSPSTERDSSPRRSRSRSAVRVPAPDGEGAVTWAQFRAELRTQAPDIATAYEGMLNSLDGIASQSSQSTH